MINKKIIESILSENAINAKKLIEEQLTIKLGERLAEEYIRISKKTFNEKNEEYMDSEDDEEYMDSEDDEEYMDSEDEEEDEEPMTESSKSKLAAMYPPEDKITRGDIIAAAQMKKKKKK
jgi:phosphopantothenoylcysteine synthetase/decarboxylase